jgi:site-specific recombinase XerD
MSAAGLTLRELAPKIRQAEVKDKSYRKYPLGQEVGHFLRAKKLEGCRWNTLEAYESVLRRFTIRHADFDDLAPFTEKQKGPELILDFIEREWGDADEHTIGRQFAVMRSFFRWAYQTDRVEADPMGKVVSPKLSRSGAVRDRVPEDHVVILISSQENVRDRGAILLLGRLGLRREDLRMLQIRDIDLAGENLLLRHAKGGKEHVLPLAFREVRDTLYLHLQERGGAPDEFYLYPKTARRKALSPAGIDGWFRRCLERAGLSGYTMHQLRHAAIDEAYLRTGDWEVARQLARHENVQTTQGYVHRDVEWLRAQLEGMA